MDTITFCPNQSGFLLFLFEALCWLSSHLTSPWIAGLLFCLEFSSSCPLFSARTAVASPSACVSYSSDRDSVSFSSFLSFLPSCSLTSAFAEFYSESLVPFRPSLDTLRLLCQVTTSSLLALFHLLAFLDVSSFLLILALCCLVEQCLV